MRRLAIILSVAGLSFLSWTAPDTFFQTLKQKFDDFNRITPPRILECIFNQTRYAPGDTAFFRINLLNANGSFPKGREMVQIVVSDSSGSLILQPRFVIQNGTGSQYLILPKEINAGVYPVCGYSHSSPRDPLLSTQITVVRDHGLVSGNSTPEISFFPEGGHWVAGVQVRVVMKVAGLVDNQKLSVAIKEGNTVVKQIEVEKNGLNAFELTPSLHNSWAAEITSGRSVKKIPLDISPDGCSLRVEREDLYFIATISIADTSKYENKTLYLQVANQTRLGFQKSFVIKKGEKSVIQIPFSEVPSGLSQLSIFDSEFNVLADEVMFHESDKPNILVTGLKEVYHNREKVQFDFSVNDDAGQSLLQHYTLSVIKKEFSQGTEDFSDNDLNAYHNQILLITKKNLIDWSAVLKSDPGGNRPEVSRGLEISGRISFKDSGLPVHDSTMISGILKNGLIAYEAFTHDNGNFTFNFLYDFQGQDELFYVVSKDGTELHNVKVEVDNETIPYCPQKTSYHDSGQGDSYAVYATKLRQVNQAFLFSKRSPRRPIDWNSQFEDELMGADRVTTLDQFTLMPTMAEVIKEIIPSLHVRTIDGHPVVRVLLRSDEKIPPVAIDEPLYCIDGELTKNTSYFLGLNPAEVAKVKLVVEKEKLERFGMLGRNGIVFVQTKRTRPEPIPDNAIIKVTGITGSASPKYPDYSKVSNRRVPDFRATLYFNSYDTEQNTSTSHTFYTSDDVGEYVVRITGRTKKGEMVNIEKGFTIVY